ncbi:hypothetical protein L226DRAFT_546041 [Lentinus tigrinus ALCF2SS1-7]|uniref:Pentacotripeptide-repeat region of PRORP domain-containing protein n=1 Tax=Lentinus tigrinus ALCF2SS1-6 TaxID=1328759 RepID=A0A5C2SEK3_9APHY|nr:hypothetical protein L227DRAFT_585396 [Lentinus tigrinus ALCF2SS1-6]RPD74670.1 hypothetical protein L226DRAFT_546041 [Lentinus tigrinus ALCF2SS1-7]
MPFSGQIINIAISLLRIPVRRLVPNVATRRLSVPAIAPSPPLRAHKVEDRDSPEQTRSHPWLDNQSRFRLYETSIVFFLRHGEVMKASILYARMTREGFIPPVILRAQMCVITAAEQAAPDEVVLDAVRLAVTNDSFNEDALLWLLLILGDGLRAPPQLMENVVYEFLKSQPPDYEISSRTRNYVAQAYLRAGDREGASRWSSKRFVPPSPNASSNVPSPYTTLLQDLAASDPSFSQYESALAEMRSEMPFLVPNLPFFNALLSHEVNGRNFAAVFAIYERMMALRSATVTPDGVTFSTIFRAISRLSTPSRTRRRRRELRPPENMPHPRTVYRDMLTCHAEQQTASGSLISPALTVPAIHAALGVFMGRHDYPAAFNVVHAFRAYPTHLGKPVLTTYHIVIRSIFERIKVELPQIPLEVEPQRIWTYRFLALHELPRHRRASIPFNLEMLRRILVMGTEPRLNLEFIHVPLSDQGVQAEVVEMQKHGIPTPLEFVGAEPVPEAKPFGVAPLGRILRRAILASMEDEVDPPYARHVSSAIADVKAELVPRG